jgi:amino acid transporter
MVGSVFSSVAWENVTFVSGEIENPQKNVVKAMVLGTISVMVFIFGKFRLSECFRQRFHRICSE